MVTIITGRVPRCTQSLRRVRTAHTQREEHPPRAMRDPLVACRAREARPVKFTTVARLSTLWAAAWFSSRISNSAYSVQTEARSSTDLYSTFVAFSKIRRARRSGSVLGSLLWTTFFARDS